MAVIRLSEVVKNADINAELFEFGVGRCFLRDLCNWLGAPGFSHLPAF